MWQPALHNTVRKTDTLPKGLSFWYKTRLKQVEIVFAQYFFEDTLKLASKYKIHSAKQTESSP